MHQGTVSVLIGVHSIVHSITVLIAWRIIYKRWPRGWEAACIFLHDVGHWGLQYLDSYAEKCEHWRRGAEIAGRLFGHKGYAMCAGHDKASGYPESPLYKADKYSWYITPTLVLYLNCLLEPKLCMGYTIKEVCRLFQIQVKKSVESGEFRSTHEFYMDRCKSPDQR